MENVSNRLEEVVSYIKNTEEYQRCMEIKTKMDSNQDIHHLVNEVKKYQKKYVQSNYDSSIKEKLDSLNQQLEEIPIYHSYIEELEKVNEMINYVRDSLNDYFTELFQ